jgi:hypothetical protein
MILYYEHLKDASGTVTITYAITTSGRNSLGINWKKDEPTFDIIRALFKSAPIAERSYNGETKVWTFIGPIGATIIEKLKLVLGPLNNIRLEVVEVQDLEAQVASGHITEKKDQKFDPKDFFYNNAAAGKTLLSRDQVIEKLASLMECPATAFASDKETLKKLYRKAALRLHPDRNNGNGAPMSELNSLWQVYNA